MHQCVTCKYSIIDQEKVQCFVKEQWSQKGSILFLFILLAFLSNGNTQIFNRNSVEYAGLQTSNLYIYMSYVLEKGCLMHLPEAR